MINLYRKFTEKWEISSFWQLVFPIFGILFCCYGGYKLSLKFTDNQSLRSVLTLLIGFTILYICLYFIKKLEPKWEVKERWELIRIFIVFSLTGSSSVAIGRPFLSYMGINKDNLPNIVYYIVTIFFSLIFYQIFLIIISWLLGAYNGFFRDFSKRMLSRFGI